MSVQTAIWHRPAGWRSSLRDYVELTKPEVNSLVLVSTFAGFYLGSPAPLDLVRLFFALLGTGLVAGGTATLNMFFERAADRRMRRTAGRPLAAGRLSPRAGFWFGAALAAAGGGCLALWVHPLASLLAILTLGTYLLCYTPLKTRTWLCTVVGAFPGAAPPLVGWAAAQGRLAGEAWALYAILFLWQFPHFLAIAWMYRDDYARGGMRMLSTLDPGGRLTFGAILASTAALIPVSLLPSLLGMTGRLYLAGALALGLGFGLVGLWAGRERSTGRARLLLHASIAYLPVLFALMLWDKRPI